MIRRIPVVFVTAVLLLAGAAALAGEALGREVTVSFFDSEKFLPAVAYNSDRGEFLVVWHNSWGLLRDIWGARLDRFGKVIETFPIATGGYDRAQAAAAYDPVRDRYLVVWIYDYYGNGSDWDVRGRLVPWDGPDTGLTEFTIWDTTDSQWNPKVAYSSGDDEFLVVWGNTSASARSTISFRFVLPDGTPDWAQTLAADAGHDFVNPDLAYSWIRDEYLVGYEIDAIDIAVRRLDHTGVPSSQILVANWPDAETVPAVATCPGQGQWLVAWKNGSDRAYARFLHGDGTVDSGPFQVADAIGGAQFSPALACHPDGSEYLIAWEQEYSGPVFGIWGRRLGADQAWRSPALAIRVVYTTQQRDARMPAVAGGALGWSTVWVQEREGTAYSDIHARTVWSLFADDFETADTAMWSAVAP